MELGRNDLHKQKIVYKETRWIFRQIVKIKTMSIFYSKIQNKKCSNDNIFEKSNVHFHRKFLVYGWTVNPWTGLLAKLEIGVSVSLSRSTAGETERRLELPGLAGRILKLKALWICPLPSAEGKSARFGPNTIVSKTFKGANLPQF